MKYPNAKAIQARITQQRLDEQVIDLITAGEPLPVYRQGCQQAMEHASTLPGDQRLLWQDTKAEKKRQTQHLRVAIECANETVAEGLFPLWAQKKSGLEPILAAIRHHRTVWLSRLLAVRKAAAAHCASLLYTHAINYADGETLATLIRGMEVPPDSQTLHGALTQQSTHRTDVLDVLLKTLVASHTPGGESLCTVALREGHWEVADRLWTHVPLTRRPDDQDNLVEAFQIVLWEGSPV